MKREKNPINNLIKIENFINFNQNIETTDKTFEKLMFMYSIAIRELETKISILKDEYKIFYDYNLIDHINTRIKTPESIIKKMKDRNLELTYKEMIENINDIAGIRIICPLKKDIFAIKKLIEKFSEIQILKEKDYITNPKKSGYSSYHLIVAIPILLAGKNIYMKVEIQIRTMAMDFWASLEHEMKYKANKEISKKMSKEWVNYAKLINKFDNKFMAMNR